MKKLLTFTMATFIFGSINARTHYKPIVSVPNLNIYAPTMPKPLDPLGPTNPSEKPDHTAPSKPSKTSEKAAATNPLDTTNFINPSDSPMIPAKSGGCSLKIKDAIAKIGDPNAIDLYILDTSRGTHKIIDELVFVNNGSSVDFYKVAKSCPRRYSARVSFMQATSNGLTKTEITCASGENIPVITPFGVVRLAITTDANGTIKAVSSFERTKWFGVESTKQTNCIF